MFYGNEMKQHLLKAKEINEFNGKFNGHYDYFKGDFDVTYTRILMIFFFIAELADWIAMERLYAQSVDST